MLWEVLVSGTRALTNFMLLGGTSPGRTCECGCFDRDRRRARNQCLCGADSPAAAYSPPAQRRATWARLADAPLRLRLRPSASSSRPPASMIPAFSLALGASRVHCDTAGSRQGVRLGLMHATGSSLGSVNSDSLYQCRFCRVIPKRSRVGRAHQLYLI